METRQLNFLVVKHAAQKAWTWCKNHTGILLAFTWALIVYVFFNRGNAGAARSVLDVRKESHKKEVEAMKEAHAQEVEKREENLATFNETVAKIEKEYEKDHRVLTRDKKKRVKRLVEDFRDKPEELTQIVSVMFGIPNEDDNHN